MFTRLTSVFYFVYALVCENDWRLLAESLLWAFLLVKNFLKDEMVHSVCFLLVESALLMIPLVKCSFLRCICLLAATLWAILL